MDRDPPAPVRSCSRTVALSRDVVACHRPQRGGAIVEAIIALPILLVVILAAIQFALIYQAKATLNHASLQAARAGAVNSASADSIRQGLARGLLPLFTTERSADGVAATTARISAELATDSRLRILNPTREAFADFGQEVDDQRQIPNDRLHVRSTAEGSASGLNIQDANVLKVEVTYGFALRVPIVDWFISRVLLQTQRTTDAFSQQLLRRNRLPILASATVRMQSPARMSELIVARSDLPEVKRVAARGGSATENPDHRATADDQENTASDEDDRHGSSLADALLGFGSGHQQRAATPSAEATEVEAAESPVSAQPTSDSATQSEDATAPLCSPTQNSAASDPDRDSGVLRRIWTELKNLAGPAVEFVKGFWEGIKEQLSDLVELITDPLEVAKGLYQLARNFIDDPSGTARAIGDALGKDLQQLVSCGAFDRGRVLGSNVDPAFMLKLATKLAKLGRLAHALDETKRAFGCASFVAGTSIWNAFGLQPIDTVRAGDWVLSRDRGTLQESPREVSRTFHRTAAGYYALVTEAEVLQVTAEHPVWVQGRGWTEVRELQPGDPVAGIGGDVLVRAAIPIDSPREVFNFTVPGTDSYFVGSSGLWVHNANCQIPPIYRAPRSPSGYAIGASDGGSGGWTEIARPDTSAYRYEKQITGAPRNVEYQVSGVRFDGYDAERGVLLDAKRWTEDCPLADCKPRSLQGAVADKMVREAMDQIDAVLDSQFTGMPIEWHIANREISEKIESILAERFRSMPEYAGRIAIVFTPDLTG